MSVRLIAISRPVVDEVPDAASLLVYCARVSSTANQLKHESGAKLLRSLITRQEWSPLEMISLTMEIVTTRDIARQILRHRSFSFQEFSQRYAEVVEPSIIRETRLQDHKDRQNSLPCDDLQLAKWWRAQQVDLAARAGDIYIAALEAGVAKEVARAVLPEGLTLSRLYVAGTLRSWIHYCALRCDPKTQKEHRIIAETCRDVILEQLPSLESLI